MDLQEQLDRAIGPAPDLDSRVDALVADGRRVVRRRRAGAVAAGLAAVLVVGGAAAVATGNGPDRRTAPVAVDPTSTATPTGPPIGSSFEPMSRVRYDRDQGWIIDPDAQVLQRIDDPYDGLRDGLVSIAVAYRIDGVEHFAARIFAPNGRAAGAGAEMRPGMRLERWTRHQESTLRGNMR
jgi:hypothetical protein